MLRKYLASQNPLIIPGHLVDVYGREICLARNKNTDYSKVTSSCCSFFLWQWDYTNSQAELVKMSLTGITCQHTSRYYENCGTEKGVSCFVKRELRERIVCNDKAKGWTSELCFDPPKETRDFLLYSKKIWTVFFIHVAFYSTGKREIPAGKSAGDWS